MTLKEELSLFSEALKLSKAKRPTKQKIIRELISNGIAWIISLGVSFIIHGFFEERNLKNQAKHAIGKFLNRGEMKDKTLVDSETLSLIQWLIVFIIGLFIFSIIEHITENYLDLRSERKKLKQ